MSASLAALPHEIVDNIAVRLGRADVVCLRAAARPLAAKTARAFAAAHFESSYYMLTRRALERLRAVAEHSGYGRAVRHLAFAPDNLDFGQGLQAVTNSVEFPRGPDPPAAGIPTAKPNPAEDPAFKREKRRRRAAYRAYVHERNRMRRTGADRTLLAGALRKLPCIESVSLRNYNPRAAGAEVPFGAGAIEAATGVRPFQTYSHWRLPDYSNRRTPPHHQFALASVIGAVVDAGVRPAAFSTEGAHSFFPVHEDGANRPPKYSLPRSLHTGFAEQCSGLRALALDVFVFAGLDLAATGQPGRGAWLLQLLARTPRLEDLRLACDLDGRSPDMFGTRTSDQTFDLLAWLPAVALPRLRRLSLRNCWMFADSVARFVAAHAGTLQAAEFVRVRLDRQGGWAAVLTALQGTPRLEWCRLSFIEERALGGWMAWKYVGAPLLRSRAQPALQVRRETRVCEGPFIEAHLENVKKMLAAQAQ